MAGQYGGSHVLEKTHATHRAVAAAPPAFTAAAAPYRKVFQQNRKTPFEYLGIGKPRIGHVRMHRIRAVESVAGARAPTDRFVVLIAVIAERKVVHSALRGAHYAE